MGIEKRPSIHTIGSFTALMLVLSVVHTTPTILPLSRVRCLASPPFHPSVTFHPPFLLRPSAIPPPPLPTSPYLLPISVAPFLSLGNHSAGSKGLNRPVHFTARYRRLGLSCSDPSLYHTAPAGAATRILHYLYLSSSSPLTLSLRYAP